MAASNFRVHMRHIRRCAVACHKIMGLALAMGLSVSVAGQGRRVTTANTNLWISHWGDHKLHQRWSVHTEGHCRRADLGAHWQQLLLRPAVNHHLNDQVIFTGGYSYYANHPYGEYPIALRNWEHNVYEQVQLSGAIGRLSVTHRFRLEQRFLARVLPDGPDQQRPQLDGYTYQSRFRYRVGLTLPLGGKRKVEPGVFTADLYDEVFLNFGDGQRLDFIQQNRISGLLGYQVTSPMRVMVGYLLQTIQRPGAAMGTDLVESNSTLHLVLVYNLDLRKKTPALQDQTSDPDTPARSGSGRSI